LHPSPSARSATHVIRVYGVLVAILDVGVKDRRILLNIARGVTLPRKSKRPHTYLSHEQVDLLATSATTHGTVVLTLAYTGLRWGEVTGLRVGDVDLTRRRLTVRENAVRVGGKILVGTPKSHEARTVPFPSFLTERLAALCEGKTPDRILFGNGLSYQRTPSTRDGWMVYALKRARMVNPTFPRLTLHDLRHTAASLAVSAGANVKALQRILGHASAAMTLVVYADLFDDDLDSVAVALDEAWTNSSVGKMWADRDSEVTLSG
jgi:integrase